MGASVRPQPSGDQIAANIAAMRSQGASDNDIEAYLQQEGIQPDNDTSLNLRNLGRSATQGATFGFGDELGLTDRGKEAAFKNAHPLADFFAKLAGGSVAPIAATVAAPELATTLGGAAMLGAGTGALTGAGEADGSLSDRAKGAALGGLLGGAGGAAAYGLARGGAGLAGVIADRMHPERAVARGAAGLLDNGMAGRLAQADAVSPGGASIATTAVPADGTKLSRFLPMLRAVGANPEAGAQAEAHIVGQKAALDAARRGLGTQMDALQGDVKVTPELRKTLSTVRTALGAKTPNVPASEIADVNPMGLEKSTPFSFDPEAETMSVGELRDALSRLRFLSRGAVKRGLEANGVDTRNIGQARSALQDFLYDPQTGHPEFATLDRNYSVASNQMRQADQALKTVQRSRANYAANSAYGATSGSLGGSLPRGTHGVVMTALDKILTNKAGAADAVANLIAKPGGPELVDQILSRVPKATNRAVRTMVPASAATIPALRGLLFSPDQP